MEIKRNRLSKQWRLVAIIVGVIAVLVILYLLRWVLLPFLLSLILAYIFLPVVSWVEKRVHKNDEHHRARRAIAILIIYIFIGVAAMT